MDKNEKNKERDPLSEAVASASNILAFADNSEKRLREKLAVRGFDDGIIDAAVNKMKSAGLINDARLIRSSGEYLAEKKLYGKSRIKLELQKKGFDRRLIDEELDRGLEDVDFKENCVKFIKKKKLTDKIKDSTSARAVTAALTRYGYGYAEIKYAYTRALEENEED